MIFRKSARSMDQLNLLLTTSALGFAWSHGTRDNMFYPTRGVRMDVRADFFGPYIGSRFTFQNYVFEIDKYIPVRKGQVFAVRAMGCGVAGEQIPFYELCQFGIMSNLRGYRTGPLPQPRHVRDSGRMARDPAMVARSYRVRWSWGSRPDGKSFNTEDLLPSGGVGLRFNLSKQRRINLRLDLTYSQTGESWSMGVVKSFRPQVKRSDGRVTLPLLDHRITQGHLTYG